jgi:hypothetical protein
MIDLCCGIETVLFGVFSRLFASVGIVKVDFSSKWDDLLSIEVEDTSLLTEVNDIVEYAADVDAVG